MDQPALPRTTRRGFLRLATGAAALGALARLPALPAGAADATADGGVRFFDARGTEILTQIAERMVDTGDPAAPRLRDTASIATIDRTCRSLDPSVTELLPTALWLFEYAPYVFDWRLRPFTRLDPAEQDASLRGWMESRFAVRRAAFFALRNLSLLGYYSQPETWAVIGYAGPLLQPGGAPA